MAATRGRIDKQHIKSTTPRSLVYTDLANEQIYFAPPTGADYVLQWDDSATDFAWLATTSLINIYNNDGTITGTRVVSFDNPLSFLYDDTVMQSSLILEDTITLNATDVTVGSSVINLTPSLAAFTVNDIATDVGSGVNVSPDLAKLFAEHNTTGDNVSLEISSQMGIISSTYPTFAGLEYFADYSANFTALSLVTKDYVDTAVGGAMTDLTFTGVSSPVTLNSSTGTDVVFTAGTGISLSQITNDLTISTTITQYTDELAQDAVGTILVDTDTIDLTYNDGTPSITAAARLQMSITSDASGIKLVNDASTPGNEKYYGTDGTGVKGFFDLPTGVNIYNADGTLTGTRVLTGGTNALRFNFDDGAGITSDYIGGVNYQGWELQDTVADLTSVVSLSTTDLFINLSDNTSGEAITIQGTTANLDFYRLGTTGTQGMSFSGSGLVITDSDLLQGMKYAASYAAYFATNPRSIPDVGYVQTLIAASPSGTVTGTGTATRVAFWSGTSALSSSANLYWDNTNSRLGVGTATPESVLDVNGTQFIRGILTMKGDTTRTINAVNNAASAFVTLNFNANDYTIQTNSNTKVTISNAGDVGIGTSSMTGKFNVKHTNGTGGFYLINDSNLVSAGWSTTATGAGGFIMYDAVQAAKLTWDGNVEQLRIKNAYEAGYTFLLTGNSKVVGNSIVMGNVGIGTTSPSYLLDVVGGDIRVHAIRIGRGAGSMNNNIAIGDTVLNANTTGNYNLAIGTQAMRSNLTGGSNVAIGAYALYTNTALSGAVAIGVNALYNCIGNFNVGIGYDAGRYITTGTQNVAIGYAALNLETTGVQNFALGAFALGVQNGASYNTAIGASAGAGITTGTRNTIIGSLALQSVTTQQENIAIGFGAARFSTGNYNTAIGGVMTNTSGSSNIGISGFSALTTGSNSVGIGVQAGATTTTGTNNTFIGYRAGWLGNGSNNIMLGAYAGSHETGTDKFMVSPYNFGNEATNRSSAIVYGQMNSTAAGQILTFNAKVGLFNQSPSAYLHLPVGVAAASGGPLKFTVSGAVLQTTPESGVLEVGAADNRIYYTGVSASRNTIAYLTDITGSITGTSGQVAFFNSGTTITSESSDFTWDSSTNRLGIRTSGATAAIDIRGDSLGTTQTTTDGLALVNFTAAAAGAQQISPAIRWRGFGWKTNSTAASQSVEFRSYVVPVQGAAAPTGNLSFGSAINASWTNDQFIFTTAGQFAIGTTTPAVTSILDLTSTTLGVLLPRMTTTQKNAISSPANGLLLYDNTLNKLSVYESSAWKTLGNGIYTGSGSLSSGTTVTMGSNSLLFNGSSGTDISTDVTIAPGTNEIGLNVADTSGVNNDIGEVYVTIGYAAIGAQSPSIPGGSSSFINFQSTSSSWVWGNHEITMDGSGISITDAVSTGLVYTADYSSNILANNSSIPDIFTVRENAIENYSTITSTTSPVNLNGVPPDYLINQGSTQATFTFSLPASPVNGEVCKLTFANAVTTLTITAQGGITMLGTAPTTAAIGTQLEYKYYHTITSWIRVK